MRKFLFALFILLIASCAWSQTFEGSWNSHLVLKDQKSLQMNLRWGEQGKNNMGFHLPLASVQGLTLDQMNGDRETVSFQLNREAGTFRFDGRFSHGEGGGNFTLTINPKYVSDMERCGYSGLSRSDLYDLAIFDATTRYLDEMKAEGYSDLSLKNLIDFKIFDVSPDFIREMKNEGYRDLSRKELVDFRIFGVNSQFIHELREEGYSDLAPSQLVTLRIFKVDRDFIREVKARQNRQPSIQKLIDMKIFKGYED